MGRRHLALGTVALLALTAACGPPGRIDSFSADYVVVRPDDSATVYRLLAAPDKVRLEMPEAGLAGGMVVITREDLGVVWTLFPGKNRYHETPTGEDLHPSLFREVATDHIVEELGRELLGGYQCRKVRIRSTVFLAGHTRTTSAVCWISKAFRYPLRMELDDGTVMELRDIVPAPQPDRLFAIPADYIRFEPRAFDFSRLESLLEGQPGPGRVVVMESTGV